MTLNLDDRVRDGAAVSREYDVQLPGGAVGSIRFTLSDMHYGIGIVLYALQRGATACGLITMARIPGGTPRSLVWTKTAHGLEIIPTGTVPHFSLRPKSTLSHCLLAFFTDVEPIVAGEGHCGARQPVNDNG